MPAFERAELTAELKVLASGGPGAVEAAKMAAGETGLAHEAGPETMVLAGGRREVGVSGKGDRFQSAEFRLRIPVRVLRRAANAEH